MTTLTRTWTALADRLWGTRCPSCGDRARDHARHRWVEHGDEVGA